MELENSRVWIAEWNYATYVADGRKGSSSNGSIGIASHSKQEYNNICSGNK